MTRSRPDPHSRRTWQQVLLRSVPAGIVGFLAALHSPTGASAQEATDASAEPVVSLLQLPDDALLSATTSAELIQALRDHLSIRLVMPSGETAAVSLKGKVGAGDGRGTPYYFQFRGFRWEGPGPLEDFSVATALEESLGEGMDEDGWDEYDVDDEESDSAWADLVEALDVGLLNADERFWRAEDESVGLRVRAVHLPSYRYDETGGGQAEEFYSCCEGFDLPILQLTASVAPSTSEPPDGGEWPAVAYEQNILIVELEPGAAPTGEAATAVADEWVLQQSQSTIASCSGADFPSAAHSESRIAVGEEEWTGRAVATEHRGRVFFLIGDMQGTDVHCTLLASSGDGYEPGRYPVRRMTKELLEGSVSGEAVFVAAFNTNDRTFVAEGGFIEITAREPAIAARFELNGWMQSATGVREDELTVAGSFVASVVPARR